MLSGTQKTSHFRQLLRAFRQLKDFSIPATFTLPPAPRRRFNSGKFYTLPESKKDTLVRRILHVFRRSQVVSDLTVCTHIPAPERPFSFGNFTYILIPVISLSFDMGWTIKKCKYSFSASLRLPKIEIFLQ